MTANELIDKLKRLIEEYGDKEVFVNGYGILDVFYDEKEDDFNIEG